jgi:transcriptional regulator with XRE-family HTH domain
MTMAMKQQKYNWSLLVRDTMDFAFLSQAAMADKLKVSQQTISFWLNGNRNPRTEIRSELLTLAEGTGLDISRYEANPDIDKITNYLKKNEAKELVRIVELYGRMNKAGRKKCMEFAETLI